MYLLLRDLLKGVKVIVPHCFSYLFWPWTYFAAVSCQYQRNIMAVPQIKFVYIQKSTEAINKKH